MNAKPQIARQPEGADVGIREKILRGLQLLGKVCRGENLVRADSGTLEKIVTMPLYLWRFRLPDRGISVTMAGLSGEDHPGHCVDLATMLGASRVKRPDFAARDFKRTARQ